MSFPTRPSAAPAAPTEDPRLSKVVGAFGAIYVIWGSTYLAIRWAIETIPPLTMAGFRFLLAGGVLFLWAKLRGAQNPNARQWRAAAVVGTLMLAGGNGAVVIAEQWIPSGLAALLVASTPIWLVVLDLAFGSRVRPSSRVWLGLATGFVGVALLVGSPGAGAGGSHELLGALLVLGAALSWAGGSLFSRYADAPPRPRMWVAMQMLCGGGVLSVLAVGSGELRGFDLSAVSLRSALALAYLVVFGALVAYAAYIWLLSVSTPTKVGTYAYVNPVVALLLGWALAGEEVSGRALLAAAVILGSVALISTSPRPRSRVGVRLSSRSGLE